MKLPGTSHSDADCAIFCGRSKIGLAHSRRMVRR